MPVTRTIEIYADTKGSAPCRGKNCGAMLTWAETVKNKKRMCFTGDPVPLRSYHEENSGRLIEAMDFDDNHWHTCPDRPTFSKGR